MKIRSPLTFVKYGMLLMLLLSIQAWSVAADKDKVTVYRCVDAKGKVSLQDAPCAKNSKQETREMLRPKDAPPAKKKIAEKVSAPAALNTQTTEPMIRFVPPPDLYQCTNYEGKTRDSEQYDPNPRCEPLWALGYQEEYLSIEQRDRYCRWVQDSCVRYEGRALCERWKAKQKQAQSDVRYAFSDTLTYKKSELARITQIVRNSCE
jgi:hypothetical protein